MAAATIQVEGLRELNTAFKRVSKDTQKELRTGLKRLAEPVRSEAEQLAAARIGNITGAWARMKVGATARTVYIQPKSRRRGGTPRPNLGGLLLRQSLLPALDRKSRQVVDGIDELVDEVAGRAGF